MENRLFKFLDKATKLGTWICAILLLVLVIHNL
jgi:hypothetical protein